MGLRKYVYKINTKVYFTLKKYKNTKNTVFFNAHVRYSK